ncbi:hypothetical protein GT045_28430 [Streptomyces sp. SID486]|uniref:hypothetical protein n=1 Tax=Streptomyces sp. SID486 TaxID=2690264 RepID=UPI0013B68DCD|nr:hypothetical protein [Streptomyces sp. SID486]MYX98622.1 hypothetical protein [Streptomyces sp. SID486]
MGSVEPVCPVCGQPVETVVKRHKTLGAWVPVWGPAPCGNPDCAAGAEAGRSADTGRPSGSTGRPSGSTGRPSGAGRPAVPDSSDAPERAPKTP